MQFKAVLRNVQYTREIYYALSIIVMIYTDTSLPKASRWWRLQINLRRSYGARAAVNKHRQKAISPAARRTFSLGAYNTPPRTIIQTVINGALIFISGIARGNKARITP